MSMESKELSDLENENELIHFGCADCGKMFSSEEIERTIDKTDTHKEIHYVCNDCYKARRQEEPGRWL